MDRSELRELLAVMLADGLTLNVKTGSSYNGGMGDGPMYDETKTLQLIFDGEVIAEEYL